LSYKNQGLWWQTQNFFFQTSNLLMRQEETKECIKMLLLLASPPPPLLIFIKWMQTDMQQYLISGETATVVTYTYIYTHTQSLVVHHHSNQNRKEQHRHFRKEITQHFSSDQEDVYAHVCERYWERDSAYVCMHMCVCVSWEGWGVHRFLQVMACHNWTSPHMYPSSWCLTYIMCFMSLGITLNSQLSGLMKVRRHEQLKNMDNPKYFVWCIHRISQVTLIFFTQLTFIVRNSM
jgi:hypothetical protein